MRTPSTQDLINFIQLKFNSSLKVILLTVLVPLIFLSFFNHPSSDDFWFATDVYESGFIKSYIDMYNGWGGTYFSIAVNMMYPLITRNMFDVYFEAYKIIPIFLLGIFFLAVFALLRTFTFNQLPNKDIFWGAVIFLVLYLSYMPKVVSGFYWLAGAFCYTLGSAFALFLLSFMYRTPHLNPKYQKVAHILICCLLAIAAIGSNVAIMVILFTIIIIETLKNIYTNHPNKLLWIIVSIVTIICTAIVVLAPGNAVRAAYYSEGHQIFYSIFNSLYWSLSHLISWSLNTTLLSITILFIPIAASLAKRVDFFEKLHIKSPALTIAICFGLIPLSIFPPYWFMGHPPPPRYLNVTYLFFLISWFFSILLIVCSAVRRNPLTSFKIPDCITYILKVMIIMGIIFNGNLSTGLSYPIMDAYIYDSQLKERYELIKESVAGGSRDIKVPPLKRYPRIIYFNDISADPTEVINQYYAKFFGLDSIAINTTVKH